MKNISFLSLFLLFSYTVLGQTFSYGVKAGYITYHRFYVNSNIEGTIIQGSQKGSNDFMDGWRFAGIVRAEHKRWSGQAEIAYAYNIGGNGLIYFVDNWNNPSNTEKIDKWQFGSSTRLKQIELNLSAGYKPLKWVRLFAGLGIWHVEPREQQNLFLSDETIPGFEKSVQIANNQRRFEYGIQESYLPWVLTRQLGIGFEIKRNFSVEIAYDRNITPVSKNLEYKSQNYLFSQKSDRFVISAGYRFYGFKKKSQIP